MGPAADHMCTCAHTCGPPHRRRLSERSQRELGPCPLPFLWHSQPPMKKPLGAGSNLFISLWGKRPGSSWRNRTGPSPRPLPRSWPRGRQAFGGSPTAHSVAGPRLLNAQSHGLLARSACRGPVQEGSRGSSPERAGVGEAGSPRVLARLTPTHVSSPHLLGAYSLRRLLPPDTSWPPPQLCPPLSSPLPPPASTNLSQTQHSGLLHLCTFACAGVCAWACFPHAPQDRPQPPRAFPGSPARLPRLGPSAEEQGTATLDYGLQGLGQEGRAACLLQNRQTINKGTGRGRTGNGHKSVCGPELSHPHVFSFYLHHHHQHHVQWR